MNTWVWIRAAVAVSISKEFETGANDTSIPIPITKCNDYIVYACETARISTIIPVGYLESLQNSTADGTFYKYIYIEKQSHIWPSHPLPQENSGHSLKPLIHLVLRRKSTSQTPRASSIWVPKNTTHIKGILSQPGFILSCSLFFRELLVRQFNLSLQSCHSYFPFCFQSLNWNLSPSIRHIRRQFPGALIRPFTISYIHEQHLTSKEGFIPQVYGAEQKPWTYSIATKNN